jgi:hypothetical protein|tara:strand:- start:990 stop:1928 length:939 start_codon:yes stop_codon:yes gene_type:complete
MSKPPLLLSFGYGHAATSPLAYTLARSNKYCHFGYTKQTNYIEGIVKCLGVTHHQDRQPRNWTSTILTLLKDERWENYDSFTGHKMNLTSDYDVIRDFPVTHAEKYLSYFTVQKYIDFNTALWEHIEPQGYKSVGDFSQNKYEHVPVDHPKVIKVFKQLQEHLDIKALVIVRDPIRRAWGQYSAIRAKGKNEQLRHFCYLHEYDRITNLLGKENCHMVVMEELWEGNGDEKDKLSEFLNYPIRSLWKNLYSPDRGHLVSYDPEVPCQSYGQNLELTHDTYMMLKDHFQYVYDNWQSRFGTLPLHWGTPINYV